MVRRYEPCRGMMLSSPPTKRYEDSKLEPNLVALQCDAQRSVTKHASTHQENTHRMSNFSRSQLLVEGKRGKLLEDFLWRYVCQAAGLANRNKICAVDKMDICKS